MLVAGRSDVRNIGGFAERIPQKYAFAGYFGALILLCSVRNAPVAQTLGGPDREESSRSHSSFGGGLSACGASGAADRRGCRGSGASRSGDRGDDRQPDHRQRGRRRGLADPASGRQCSCSGAGASVPAGFDDVRRRGPVLAGVGGVGQRSHGARAGLSRYVPRRGVLASRRQHPADPGRGPACRMLGTRSDSRSGNGLRDPGGPGACDLLARAQDRPCRASGPLGSGGHRHAAGLDTETIYQAIGQALHTTTATRHSRKGEISSWKAYAPAFAGKMAVEAVDRAMRGEAAPAPIWEGEDGVIA